MNRRADDKALPDIGLHSFSFTLVGLPIDLAHCGGYNQSMTAEPKRRIRQAHKKPPDAVQEAIDYGIDVAAIRDNLALTPAERLRRHQIALDRVRTLQKARFL